MVVEVVLEEDQTYVKHPVSLKHSVTGEDRRGGVKEIKFGGGAGSCFETFLELGNY